MYVLLNGLNFFYGFRVLFYSDSFSMYACESRAKKLSLDTKFLFFFFCCQFHQHFTNSFLPNIISPKKLKTQIVSRKKLLKTLLYKKTIHKMLVYFQFFSQTHWHTRVLVVCACSLERSVSPTNQQPTSLMYTTRSYTQLSWFAFNAINVPVRTV